MTTNSPLTTNSTHLFTNTFGTPYNTVERNLWSIGDGRFGVQTWLRFLSGNSFQDGWLFFDNPESARTFAERSEY